ncbi:MAG: pyruvate kinase, partial [Rhodospirillales bacterium]|nr:pyruvate kinase [Rhodospirillales bacterium]
MRRKRHAKIVSTLGPATGTDDAIARLFEAGADVFRLNFSHGTHDEHAERFATIREMERMYGRPIGIIADLQGPKLRIGNLVDGQVHLESGAPFRLDLLDEPGDLRRAPLPHPEIFQALRQGTNLLLDDGKVRLHVTACGPDFADTRVINGGFLSDHKGVNVPDAVLDLSALTAKDRADLEFVLELGIGWIALSFVQRPEDIEEAKELIGGRANLLAKLEKPSAIAQLAPIVDRADAVMVARGDLGVEMPPEDVPVLQKRIIRACRAAGKPVIVATQMLDSMVESPMPTRAEASDVATAIYAGADAVMLSAETAVGRYPVEAVTMMDRIIKRVESDTTQRAMMDATRTVPETTTSASITAAARQVAETAPAAAIVTFTASGSTTVRVSRERPPMPILALTPVPRTARRLCLAWGVHSVEVAPFDTIDAMIDEAVSVALQQGFATVGERLVVTAGTP